MKAKDVIRAWKDEAYRNSLSFELRTMLWAENPAGAVELRDADLASVAGGVIDPSEEDQVDPPEA